MSEELRLFLEDSEEQMTFMENALVAMQENGVNEEDIGALFRAMHTIKGTAGMFGFDDVVKFTHTAESLLSEVRTGKVELTAEMLNLFLLCKDHTEMLVELASQNEDINDEVQETNDALLVQLIALMPENANAPKAASAKPVEVVKETVTEANEATWHVSVNLNEDFFSSGMDIGAMFSCLEDLGTIKKLVPFEAQIPLLEGYNPVAAYLDFDILLCTSVSAQEIEEVFEFILDDLELSIFKIDDKESLKNLIKSKHHDEIYKTFLVQNKLYTQAQIDALENKPKVAAIVEKAQASSEVSAAEDKSQKKPAEQKHFSLRVDSSKVDQLINQISEMVIANARIAQRVDQLDDTDLGEATTIMSDMLEEVRSSVMNIRMIQVGDSFAKFKRIVNDTAKKMGKEVEFVINGGDTELDKMVVEKISDPIMHMLRNSIDHGVEMPEERIANGKDAKGNVTLSAYPDAGMIVIEIRDDGKGLNKERILEKAIASGAVPANHNLSDKEIYNLIFAAGLSTTEKVSDISGRGVGMDVVRRNIGDLRGTVEIDSTPGKGSLFTIRLPLTLAIIDGFLIQSGETKYIIPLEMIQECIELSKSYKEHMRDNEFINLRDSILPILNVREYFKESASQTNRENVVVVRYGEYKMGLQVDELYGEFQTVIKPLGEIFENVAGISGGTILGSGEIALIFDIPKLIERKIREVK